MPLKCFLLSLMIVLAACSASKISEAEQQRIIMVQEFPQELAFYNTVQQDYFNLVFVYPYKRRFFLPYRPKEAIGQFAFQSQTDASLLYLSDKELLFFLARNNLATPKHPATLFVDKLGTIVPIFLLFMFLVPIFLLTIKFISKQRARPQKEKNPGYLRRTNHWWQR